MTTLADLKQNILDDTHRPDKAAELPKFIRQGEGLIRRELDAYLLQDTIAGDSDQIVPGQFSLPPYFLRERSLHVQGEAGEALDKVAPYHIRRLPADAPVREYAILGGGLIEFRGQLRAEQRVELLYYGTPAPLVADDDTNTLLQDHEGLYQSAAQFYLYKNTQDIELAQAELELFQSIMRTLNRQVAREMQGPTIPDTYTFSRGSSY